MEEGCSSYLDRQVHPRLDVHHLHFTLACYFVVSITEPGSSQDVHSAYYKLVSLPLMTSDTDIEYPCRPTRPPPQSVKLCSCAWAPTQSYACENVGDSARMLSSEGTGAKRVAKRAQSSVHRQNFKSQQHSDRRSKLEVFNFVFLFTQTINSDRSAVLD